MLVDFMETQPINKVIDLLKIFKEENEKKARGEESLSAFVQYASLSNFKSSLSQMMKNNADCKERFTYDKVKYTLTLIKKKAEVVEKSPKYHKIVEFILTQPINEVIDLGEIFKEENVKKAKGEQALLAFVQYASLSSFKSSLWQMMKNNADCKERFTYDKVKCTLTLIKEKEVVKVIEDGVAPKKVIEEMPEEVV